MNSVQKNSANRMMGRLILCTLLQGTMVFSLEVNEIKCEPFEKHGNVRLEKGTLSPLWAQEMVGADLARETVRQSPLARMATVGILESGFHPQNISKEAQIDLNAEAFLSLPQGEGRYGDLLANLIFDSNAGVAGKAKFTAPASSGWPMSYERVFEASVFFLGSRPDVLAIPLDLGDEDKFLAAWQRVADQGTILVIAAGDGFPRPIREVAGDLNGIRVGSIAESGFMDMTSQEDVGLDIAAPAGRSIQTTIHSESGPEWESFSGTRAATGLVTGAVANVVSFLPGITVAEVRALIRITAQTTLNQREPVQRNGAGMLNAYKMAEVAKDLRTSGWPKNRKQILSPKSPVYDFKTRAEKSARLAQRLAPIKDCKSLKKKIRLLRSSYLLSGNEESRQELELAYRRVGLTQNASFLATMSPQFAPLIKKALQKDRPQEIQLAALRAAGNLGLEKNPLRILESEAHWLDSYGQHGDEVQNRVLVAMAISHHPKLDHFTMHNVKPSVLVQLLGMASTMGRTEYALKFANALRPYELDISPAVAAGQTEIVKMLLAKGAPINGTERGRTPLTYAMNLRWNYEVAELLIDHGANVNQLTTSGETALTAAIIRMDDRMVELLLDKQADPMLGKQRGRTAIALAYAQRNKVAVGLLCRHGAVSEICRQPQTFPGTAEQMVAANQSASRGQQASFQ